MPPARVRLQIGMGRRIAEAVGTALLLVAFLGAQGTAGAQPAQAQKPKPTPEHERLQYFVGNWTTEGEVQASPMGPAGKITSTDRCEWFEGRFAVVCHSTGKTPMGPSKSLGILGYNAEEKVYTYYGVDNSAMVMTSVPRGTVQDGTWTYTDESMMGGKKMKTRVTITQLSPSAYTFRMEMQGPDGAWTPLMEAKSTKTMTKTK